MGTAIKHPVSDRVKPSFKFLTSGHSDAQSARMSTITNGGLAQDALSVLYPYGNSGRQGLNMPATRM